MSRSLFSLVQVLTVGLLLTASLCLAPGIGHAQATASADPSSQPSTTPQSAPSHEIIYVGQGRPAPFAGALIDVDDLAWFRLEIERLRHELALDVATETQRCDVRLSLEQARTLAATQTTELHDSLYDARIVELVASLSDARAASVRQPWEHPALWFAIGVVVSVVAVVAVAASVR